MKGFTTSPSTLTDIEFHLLDTRHFALEEESALIADYIRAFFVQRGLV